MSIRRSPDRTAAARAWRHFIERNAEVLSATSVPSSVTDAIGSWDEFLIHGFVAGDPEGFRIDRLSEAQYSALVEFATNYFAAGYEFYTPRALRPEDQESLSARFANSR